MIKIALLGSTGSIGRQVLEVVDRYPEKFKIVSLAAGKNAAVLCEQINKYKPEVATLSDGENAYKISEIPSCTSLYVGENSYLHAVTESADVVFAAMMGFSGLSAVDLAIRMKKKVALANKETLVAGGKYIMPLAKLNGVDIIPVDSEHSALWQCLSLKKDTPFEKLVITASGGAFRDLPVSALDSVTAEDALKHPNWQMGKKITIDCATMVNKGFEVIEAMWLFDAPLDKIEVLIHPESVIHSMVRFVDGSVMAQMANPSMEIPISLALTYPERLYTGVEQFDFVGKSLNFKEIDEKKYPCFSLVMQSIKMGYNYPCALSGANEEAVKLFLEGKIKFTEIYKYIEYALLKTEKAEVNFENLEYTDKLARKRVFELYNGGKNV